MVRQHPRTDRTAAHQQAQYLAKALPGLLCGQPVAPFRYRYKGTIVSLGDRHAIGEVGAGSSLRLRGIVVKLVYIGLYVAHFAVILGWPKVAQLMLRRDGGALFRQLPLKLHNVIKSN